MRQIEGVDKSISSLLSNVKYSIDNYQREYRWEENHISELIDDLTGKFLENYQEGHLRSKVAEYPHYFLGSIIISEKQGTRYIVDGQQRLTSLTLLLLFLRNLQKDREDKVDVDRLIFSEVYGQKSFNLHVDEREACMNALFKGIDFDSSTKSESVQNLYQRYQDIETHFPQETRGTALPYFIDWLINNVILIEITAHSDEDAYTIFETMNDRGLSLSPTEMLKGYLLANIEEQQRSIANLHWRQRLQQLNEFSKETDSDFLKNWFRSQYSQKIRERKKSAKPEDFDRIGTEFHRWMREASSDLGINTPDEYFSFLNRDFDFYSQQYLTIMKASRGLVDNLEHIYYVSQTGFTLQFMLLLAPITPHDKEEAIVKKLQLVARFIDIFLARRVWNFKSNAYSTLQYTIFNFMKEIRRLSPNKLATKLRELLEAQQEGFSIQTESHLYLHQQNRRSLHLLLSRITDFVEINSGQPSRYSDYSNALNNVYEIEHIWANHPERYSHQFSHETEFNNYRNRFGGLLLLPKSFNASYGDLPYARKLPHYNTQNLLARSLHVQCYERNPGFLRFIEETGLPFEPYEVFEKHQQDKRYELYTLIARRVWDPSAIVA